MSLLAGNGPATKRASAWPAFWLRWLCLSGCLVLLSADLCRGSETGLAAAANYKGWTVERVRVLGVTPELATSLVQGLALSGQSRLLGRKRALLFARTLEADLERTRLFLARHGYPHAEITVQCEPTSDQRRVMVTLAITPGEPVRIASVTVTGLPNGIDRQRAPLSTVQEGQPLTDTGVATASRTLVATLQQAGYPFARVEPGLTRIAEHQVALEFRVDPGSRCRFGETVVTGVSDDLVGLVRKIVAAPRGAIYSPQVARQAQESLRGLGLFRQVRLTPHEADPGVVDLHADLAPRSPRSTEIGFGYWTDDYLRASARWRHANLLRGGRGLELFVAASRFQQEVGTSLWWPALLGSRTRVSGRLKLVDQNEESYDLRSTEFGLAAAYRFSLATSLQAGMTLSDVNVHVKTDEAEAFLEQGGLLTIFSLRWSRDHSDDRVYPTRGTVAWFLAEWAPSGMLSESHFVSLQGSGTWYRELITGTVLATRIAGGVAAPIDDSMDLLPNKRFYAGGPSSMRGARRRKLGPTDADGAPLGGEAMTLASAEIRFPLFWLLHGVLFADAGQVVRNRETLDVERFEVAVGPGLMVRTPVGPLRADFAWNLTDRPTGEPVTLFHLSVGHPF
ncbi:MAG: BamA/TamA family outer membrane protein [bacterium]